GHRAAAGGGGGGGPGAGGGPGVGGPDKRGGGEVRLNLKGGGPPLSALCHAFRRNRVTPDAPPSQSPLRPACRVDGLALAGLRRRAAQARPPRMPHSASPGPHAARFLGVLLLLLTTGVARVATAVVDDGSDYLRSGTLTWRPIPGTPRGIAFDLTVGMRRSAIPNPDAPDIPVVGSLVDEVDILDFGDGDCDWITYEVTAMDAAEEWSRGAGVTPRAPPRTGAIDKEDEPNGAPTTANPITRGGDVGGRIGPAGDVDFFQFAGTAGPRLVIDTRLTGLEDSVVTLLAADGTEILTNDDVGDSECRRSHLDLALPPHGTFFS